MKNLQIKEIITRLKKGGRKTYVVAYDQFYRSQVMVNLVKEAGQAEQHDFATDVNYVLAGSGKLQKGGDLVDKFFRSFGEWRGSELKGYESLDLKPGTITVVPTGISHRTIPNRNSTLILLTCKQYSTDYLDGEKLTPTISNKIKRVKALIMDVDGVMTDGKVLLNTRGEEFAVFSRIDGMGIGNWQQAGFLAGIISKEKVSIATARAKKLNIVCHQGVDDKLTQAKDLLKTWGVNFDQVCFVGDDINDLDLLKEVGFSVCPKDAQVEVKKAVDLVLSATRGQHAVRELIDLMLAVKSG